jgi:toxin-antitoxin system PIN domain toxin
VKTFLFDANLLLALAWPNHPFHQRAVTSVTHRRNFRCATCSLTQAAFARLSSNSQVMPEAKTPAEAGALLQRMVSDRAHVFLEPKSAQTGRLLELLARCHSHNQVNDAFLLWIVQTRDAILLTFDLPLQHLAPGPQLVEVIA